MQFHVTALTTKTTALKCANNGYAFPTSDLLKPCKCFPRPVLFISATEHKTTNVKKIRQFQAANSCEELTGNPLTQEMHTKYIPNNTVCFFISNCKSIFFFFFFLKATLDLHS